MKATVFHGVGDIRVDNVPDPELRDATDAIVRLTASAICGTDLHFVRGTMAGVKPGTILGHEGVGVVEQVGTAVRNFAPGDRVVICSTIGCGACSYCRAGYYAQCDRANPNGPQAGTCFFGGPEMTGPVDGLQAEKARIPFAHTTLVGLPDEVSDDAALPCSDIFPTGWFGAELAEVGDGDTVVVSGCGPVGIFAILSAHLHGAGRVLAVDRHADRLDTARRVGAEPIDSPPRIRSTPFASSRTASAPTARSTRSAWRPSPCTSARAPSGRRRRPRSSPRRPTRLRPSKAEDGHFQPGGAPSIALRWAVRSVVKAGTLGIIGVYPAQLQHFPIGEAMNKNLSINLGNCNHRAYVPKLVEMVRTGAVDPSRVLTQLEGVRTSVEAYEAFDERRPGWLKVELEPSA